MAAEVAEVKVKTNGRGCLLMIWTGVCLLGAVVGLTQGSPSVYIPFALAVAVVELPVQKWMAGRLDWLPQWLRISASVALGVFAFVAYGNQPPPPPPTDTELAARMDNLAIPTFSESQRNQYPRLFRTLGPRVSEVEGLARRAALIALRSGECDRVTIVGPRDTSTRENIEFYVDCANETRVTLDERQILSGARGVVETGEARADRNAQMRHEDDILIAQSQQNVASNLRDPGSADFGPTVVSRRDGIAVCGTVNARNGFGGMSGTQRFINTQSNGIFLEETRADFAVLWRRYCG